MSVTRRTGLGAILGGIFAAPAVAQSGAQIKGNYPGYSGYSTMETDSPQAEMEDPITRALKEAEYKRTLIDTANGNLSKYELEELEHYDKVENNRCDDLKSISDSYRSIMRMREQRNRQRKLYVERAKHTLLKRFGITL